MTQTLLDRTFESLVIGEEASLERVIEASDIDAFASVSGDYSSLHVDETYASTTPFEHRVVHGMLLGAYMSSLIGMQLPGKSALLVRESLEFKKPAYIGTKIKVSVKLVSKSEATRLIELATSITSEGVLLAEGSATVQVRS